MKALFLLAALSLVACSDIASPTSVAPVLAAPAGAAHDVLTNEKYAFSGVFVVCNGEPVVVSGDRHFVIKMVTPAGGGLRYTVSDDSHFSGIGTVTGAKYEGSSDYAEKVAINSSGLVFSTSSSMYLGGQGKVPNTVVDWVTQFTIHPDGSVSHEDYNFKTRCR